MSAQIKISQAGLAAGVAGVSRTDGLATGALVTLEDVGTTGVTSFHLLWGPPNDTTALASLAVTGNPRIWTFSPTVGAWGTYRIELLRDGVRVERRIFGIRSPNTQLLTPAFNEQASRLASWDNAGADQKELSENNAVDLSDASLNTLAYAGWWRSLRELYAVVEAGTGGLANNAVTNAKLAQMATNTVKANPTAGTANAQDLAVGTNTVLGRVAGNVVAALLVNAQIATNTITPASLAQMAANSIKANPTAATANQSDVTVAVQSLLIRSAGNLVQATAVANDALQRIGSGDLGFSTRRSGLVGASAVVTISAAVTVIEPSGTYVVPAGAAVGDRYTFEFSALFIRGATATALNLEAFFDISGGNVTFAYPTPTAAGTYSCTVRGSLTVLTTGAGGTCVLELSGFGSAFASVPASTTLANTAVAYNTTAACTIRAQTRMSAAVASTQLISLGGHISRAM